MYHCHVDVFHVFLIVKMLPSRRKESHINFRCPGIRMTKINSDQMNHKIKTP